MKRKSLALILTAILCIGVFSGCSDGDVDFTGQTIGGQGGPKTLVTDTASISNAENLQYVMIYNPNIYDELKNFNEKLNTGDFADSVEAVISKADGLEQPEIPEYIPRSVAENGAGVEYDKFELDGNRAGKLVIPYEKGDTHSFYAGMSSRTLKTFTCRYAGQSCNIWTYDNSSSDSDIEACGREFDSKIYPEMIKSFGKSRFAENGGKVNILIYPMEGSYGGFFRPADLFASEEVPPSEIARYTINTDHDIININSLLLKYDKKVTFGTIAHEFQHLICFTNYFFTAGNGINMRTWLNEAMSGYIEEKLYAGTKDASGHYDEFAGSTRIRHGQSMYNFDVSTSSMDFDIGVYGSVYLFSEYLAKSFGDNIFSSIHSYWRDSYSTTLDEAEAIAKSVSQDQYNRVNDYINFENQIRFTDADEEWLSKLTLQFYLSLLSYDQNDPAAFEKVKGQTLLYDEINPADIEGGGRVIVALKDGKFEFPTDADNGMIYVGLDAQFKPITEFVLY